MSKLEELIQKLCPDGVEYLKVGDISEVSTGKSNKSHAIDCGKYPFFVRSKNIERMDKFEFDEEAIIIPGEGGIGDIYHYINGKYSLHQRVYRIHFKYLNINVKFAYYYFCTNFKSFISKKAVLATVTSIRKPMIESFQIPIPPLEIQEEIVHILDSFTELTNEITTKLADELTLRKRQYEYYRDSLLTFGDEVERVRLKEVCINFIVPMRDKPKKFDGNIPWCRIEDAEGKYLNGSKSGQCVSQEIINEMNLKVFPIGTVICSCSASIGTYLINTQPLITNQTFIGIVTGEKLKNSYLRYYMETQTENLILLSNTSTIPYISRKKFEDMIIPLPPLSEQERIVSILDKFDSLCNDITNGLPAEIEARKKQYEYYRDKLLTFKNKNGT